MGKVVGLTTCVEKQRRKSDCREVMADLYEQGLVSRAWASLRCVYVFRRIRSSIILHRCKVLITEIITLCNHKALDGSH